jgi:hypothetical protein
LVLLHDTVAFNKAADTSDGAGIFASRGIVSLQDTLLAQNTLFSGVKDNLSGSGFTSAGHNLVDDASGNGFLGTSDVFGSNVNAGLSTTLQINQLGQTKTYALLAGSKAIGTGDTTSLTLNQNGHAWVLAPSDIGAY